MLLRLRLFAGSMLLAAFSAGALAQGFQIHWVCDPKEKRLYRRDLGVVCWDGTTYSKEDPGGIPQYMIDYFDQMRRDVAQKVGEMNQHVAELKAKRPVAAGPTVIAARQTVPIPAAPEVRHKPVSPEAFASIEKGMKRTELIEKLGEPMGSISIPNDDGFIEVWTYSLTDGGTAKVRIEAGVVVSHQVERQSSGR
ncbi:MAG TPA: hypothetical protein VKU01_34860 [Bryobacteraceae bacterium]|nr:hypothetical protein [Bryobacteraceae bacterium]